MGDPPHERRGQVLLADLFEPDETAVGGIGVMWRAVAALMSR